MARWPIRLSESDSEAFHALASSIRQLMYYPTWLRQENTSIFTKTMYRYWWYLRSSYGIKIAKRPQKIGIVSPEMIVCIDTGHLPFQRFYSFPKERDMKTAQYKRFCDGPRDWPYCNEITTTLGKPGALRSPHRESPAQAMEIILLCTEDRIGNIALESAVQVALLVLASHAGEKWL